MSSSKFSGQRWTVCGCPTCGSYVPFSGMDAAHGGRPACGCTAEIVTDDRGLGSIRGHTDAVAVEVMPVSEHEAMHRQFADEITDAVEANERLRTAAAAVIATLDRSGLVNEIEVDRLRAALAPEREEQDDA